MQWWLYQAFLDPTVGSEQSGIRPVLIVSNDEFNEVTTNVTIVPLTSTVRELYSSEVSIPAGLAGQRLDSIVLAHQLRTISKQRLRGKIGELREPQIQDAVRSALREHLGLE